MKRLLLTTAVAVFLAAVGCFALTEANASDSKKAANAKVTFTKDVAPIFYSKCVECHRAGEIAPMSLMSYKEARPWARSIKEKVVTKVMPPWHADPKHGAFSNDRRLSQKEVETIAAWVDGGALEGNPKELPPTPKFVEGWNIGKPDLIFQMPEACAVPASGVVAYKYFNVPTNFTEDKWVQAAEIRPENRSVVHHIIVFIQTKGRQQLLTGWAPGEQPAVMKDGLAKRIPAGATLVFQVHYTPNGKAASDRSYVGLIFAKEKPRNELLVMPVLNMKFVIPAGEANYQVESSYTFKEDAHIRTLMPHMHLRGKDFLYRVTYPDGHSEIILSVPKYDFNWQTYYFLKEPVAAPKGTRVDCLAHFDNSTQNKYNPDATTEVKWGDQTFEEMMIGWMSYTLDKNEVKTGSAEPSAQKVSRNQ
ncbi:MAG: cytochrome c [Acidobacteria bacterium]|nr:cytochrome c [Acidobacteriota bacterium]